MVLNFIHCLWLRSQLRLGRCNIHHQSGTPSPENVRAFSAENSPTMPSADFCMTITHGCPFVSCFFNIMQISRGKTHSFHDVDARFIKYSPNADGRLRGHVPARLSCIKPQIWFLYIIPSLWIGLPSDPASRQRPCPFPSLRLCENLARGLSPL